MGTSRSVLRQTRLLRLLVAAALLAACVLQPSTAVAGTTIAVNTTADSLDADGSCSLREAIRAANLNTAVGGCPAGSAASADTITVPAGTYTISRIGANEDSAATGDFDMAGNVAIDGAGAGQTILNGAGLDRVLHVLAGVTASITDLTITNGLTPRVGQDGDHGGGIYNGGTLTVSRSRVTNNAAQSGADGFLVWNDDGLIVSETPGGNGGHGGGIYNHGTLTLTDSTVGNNAAGDGGEDPEQDVDEDGADGGSGGGVYNHGTMTIANSAITGNKAGEYGSDGNRDVEGGDSGRGGGIYNGGTLTVTNSTVSGNVNLCGCGVYNWPDRGGDGGGISNYGTMTLTGVTITNNITGWLGGGVHNADAEPATTSIRNSIIAGNSAAHDSHAAFANDCVGTLTSQGYNLVGVLDFQSDVHDEPEGFENCTIAGDTTGNRIGVDPKLGPLQDNGGPTFTHALMAGSPAMDAGSSTGCPTTDQRGIARPQDGDDDGDAICDIGAYEYEPVAGTPIRAQIMALRAEVAQLGEVGASKKGPGHALMTKLDGVLQKLEHGNTEAAANQLHAFVNQVEAFHKARKLTTAQAQPLLDQARDVIEQMGQPSR